MKKYTCKDFIPIVIKVLIIIFGIIGQICAIRENAPFNHLLYYTNQTNIAIIITSIIFLGYDILGLIKGKENVKIPNILKVIRYVMTFAITITFVVFTTLLVPAIIVVKEYDFLFSLENIMVHNLVPILAVVDFFLYATLDIKKHTYLLGLIMPVYYIIFVFIVNLCNVSFISITDGTVSKFPYFFLDYEKNGFFSIGDGKFGVFYYFIILLVVIIASSYFFLKGKSKINTSKH